VRERPASAFDVLVDRTLTVMHHEEAREVTVEEAMQHKTYQDALAGNRAAQREVIKMITKREEWLATREPPLQPPQIVFESTDPDNANEAMVLLGIAERDTRARDPRDTDEYLLLQPWAVQVALSRRRGRSLSKDELKEIKFCTRDADTIRWPSGVDT
jgi:hypothetical protein